MPALNELHVYGEEFLQKTGWRADLVTRPTSIQVGLFDSSDAGLTVNDSMDITDITTAGAEPSGGNYARQTANLDGSDVAISENTDGDWEIDVADQVFTPDGTDSKTVDAYFVILPFNSTTAGDTAANDHIMFTGDLSQSRDLSQIDELTVDNVSMSLE